MKAQKIDEKKMRKNIRRTTKAHPLVSLMPRRITKKDHGTYQYWAARWRDPETGKLVEFKLDPSVFPSREARRQWCITKSRSIAKRKAEIASGAPKATRTPLSEGITTYLEGCANRLRPATVETYAKGLKLFSEWAEENGITTVEEITSGRLTLFREYATAQRKRIAVPSGKRGARRSSAEPLSKHSVNRDIRSVKAAVIHWRRLGILTQANREGIGDSLKTIAGEIEPPSYLSPADIRRLLESALRHDKECFTETRLEHTGALPPGSTRRYEPISPLVAFILLSGCRIGEVEKLKWADVELEALDCDGRKVGEIRLSASATKTKRARTIGLEVCPSLRSLLAALKLQAGSKPYVFGGKSPLPHTKAEAARKRLIRSYGAPRFSWQNLRQTAGTYLTNAPGIYGGASVFMSARQLGHSVTVAEKHYLGVVRGISKEARTLEAAMQIEDLTKRIVESVRKPLSIGDSASRVCSKEAY